MKKGIKATVAIILSLFCIYGTFGLFTYALRNSLPESPFYFQVWFILPTYLIENLLVVFLLINIWGWAIRKGKNRK